MKNLIAVVTTCNKMPHTTHRKKQISIQHFLPPSHCLQCSQHTLGWNICLCLLHTRKSSARPSFTYAKPQCIFGLANWQFWLAQSWSTLLLQSCIPETEQEPSPSFWKAWERWGGKPLRPCHRTLQLEEKLWCLLMPVFTRKQKTSKNLSKPQRYCSEVSVSICKYTTWFFLPPDTVVSVMDMGHFHRKSSVLVLRCARVIRGEETAIKWRNG